jgi:cobalt-precorrin-5B (C1)-methyltransferase
VRKDAGDDPDVTDGSLVIVRIEPVDGDDIAFAAGEGVGQVTLPGLQIPPGGPAINPGPRRMIAQALREVTASGLRVTVSIPGGAALAAKTFNPRLGIEGGLSVLGTSGRVRPFSAPALRDSLKCGLDVAAGLGIQAPILVPGNIGEKAVNRHYKVHLGQVIPVSNEWGFMLEQVAGGPFDRVLLAGHPGKLAKMANGEWDTHSSRSGSAVPVVRGVADSLGIEMADGSPTVEGLFEALSPNTCRQLGDATARAIRSAVQSRFYKPLATVVLINMRGDLLGTDGDLSSWL